ncbi:MAG: FtsX-like permease family protein [Planctomycetaceae bacterium]|nr:FtsX-like permease family protein [Planctomycetaceae bacterium]
MILWKFTLREVKHRPGRATLTLLSIVIGVAAVVAVTVGTATTDRVCQEMYASVVGRAALEIVAQDDGFFDGDLAEQVEKVPCVKAVAATVQRFALLRGKDHKCMLMAMGIDPTRDAAVRDYELAEGSFFQKKYDLVLEAGFARGFGVRVGDEVRLATSRGGLSGSIKTFRVVGLLSPKGVAGFKQGSIAFLPLKTAQQLLTKSGYVNVLSVVLADGADEHAVAKAIQAALPTGLTVRLPVDRTQLSKETVEKVQKGLDFAYTTILALAFFTILNTFLMNVGERRKQLAVLRAIGATRRQVIRMLLVEGLVMGVVGTLLGTAIGLGGAQVLAESMSKIYAAPAPAIKITPAPFLTAGIVGPVVSVLAMFIPAWIAGRVTPLEGMRFVASEGSRRTSLAYAVSALTVFATTGSVMAACIVGYLPPQVMIVVGVVFTAAFILVVPVLLGPLARLASALLYPVLRTEGRIAERQVLRRRVRTTLTVGVLYIAVSTAVSLGTNILNTVDDIHAWMNKTLKGDYMIRAMSQDATTGASAKMPESLTGELRAIDGVTNVDVGRQVKATVRTANGRNGDALVIVRDFTDYGVLPLDIKDCDPVEVRQRLARGEVVMSTTLAHRVGAKTGGDITLETQDGPKQLKVAATATVYAYGGRVIYMEGQTARQIMNLEGVDMFIVSTAPGKAAAVGEQLDRICKDQGYMLQSFVDLRQRVDDITKGVIAGLWGLLVLGLVVGAFAIANTLTMNVLEQTRELALLRVVAMTRWQVRKTIFAQAILIGVIGLGSGCVGGMIGAYVMNLSQLPLLGHAPAFALHPSLLIACFGVGLAVILAAAWLPAERAARLNLLIALQYE